MQAIKILRIAKISQQQKTPFEVSFYNTRRTELHRLQVASDVDERFAVLLRWRRIHRNVRVVIEMTSKIATEASIHGRGRYLGFGEAIETAEPVDKFVEALVGAGLDTADWQSP